MNHFQKLLKKQNPNIHDEREADDYGELSVSQTPERRAMTHRRVMALLGEPFEWFASFDRIDPEQMHLKPLLEVSSLI